MNLKISRPSSGSIDSNEVAKESYTIATKADNADLNLFLTDNTPLQILTSRLARLLGAYAMINSNDMELRRRFGQITDNIRYLMINCEPPFEAENFGVALDLTGSNPRCSFGFNNASVFFYIADHDDEFTHQHEGDAVIGFDFVPDSSGTFATPITISLPANEIMAD